MVETIFWSCAGLVLWAYAGYPATIFARSLLQGREPRTPEPPSPTEWPSVSVLLAVRDEADRLATRLENLLQQDYPEDRLRVLILCNGCTDGTDALAERLARKHPGRVRSVTIVGEGGKAEALNRGAELARGDLLVFADARQRFEADAIRRLAAAFSDPEIGAASGRLVIDATDVPAVSGVRAYWGFETRLRQAESLTGSTVGVTGAIYAMRRELFEELPGRLILDDLYLPLGVVRAGYRVVLVPEAVARDRPSKDLRTEFARKLRTLAGNLQLVRMDHRVLSPRANPVLWRYLSHKVLRVFVPLLVLLLIPLGFASGATVPTAVAGTVAAVHLVGLLGLVVPGRWLAIPAGLVLLHAAGVTSLVMVGRDARKLW